MFEFVRRRAEPCRQDRRTHRRGPSVCVQQKRVLSAPSGRRRRRVSRETDPLCAINLMKVRRSTAVVQRRAPTTAPRPWASAKQEPEVTYVPFLSLGPRDLIHNAALSSAREQIKTELIGRRWGEISEASRRPGMTAAHNCSS